MYSAVLGVFVPSGGSKWVIEAPYVMAAAHDLMHTVQAERALMQPFVAGSGKWRGYFADHDAEAAR